MTVEQIVTIIVAILGSSLIQFLISRHDARKDKLEEIYKELSKLEKDDVRVQMLIMLALHPENKEQILMLAEYYFHKLKGDWYMTDLFGEWLREEKIALPGWFELKKEEDVNE